MSLSDEIQKLADLRTAGFLSEGEFQAAKLKLLQRKPYPRAAHSAPQNDSLGRAANRFVLFHIIMTLVGIMIALLALFLWS